MLKYVYNMKMKRELENWGGYISYHILKYYAELYLVEAWLKSGKEMSLVGRIKYKISREQ